VPRYDYECLSCGHVFELRQSFSADPVGTCPQCEGRSRRKFHAVPVIYKGSGFYTTDYARSNLSANGTGPDSSESKEETEKTEKTATKGKKEESAKATSSEKKADSDKTVTSSSKSEG